MLWQSISAGKQGDGFTSEARMILQLVQRPSKPLRVGQPCLERGQGMLDVCLQEGRDQSFGVNLGMNLASQAEMCNVTIA
jgi:hypothetical protein